MTPDPHFPSRLALQLSAWPAEYNLTSVLEFEAWAYSINECVFGAHTGLFVLDIVICKLWDLNP